MEYVGIGMIPLVIGLLEVLKKAGAKEKYIPVFSLMLGLVFGILFVGGNIKEGIIQGIYIGLSAVGLFSGTKNVVEGISVKREKNKLNS
ncbi:MAG: hypothetical protein GX962_05235 [Epulopiscium sp.]|nr:hypothetical protein [Candidatus Epulonipiscium sp.]